MVVVIDGVRVVGVADDGQQDVLRFIDRIVRQGAQRDDGVFVAAFDLQAFQHDFAGGVQETADGFCARRIDDEEAFVQIAAEFACVGLDDAGVLRQTGSIWINDICAFGHFRRRDGDSGLAKLRGAFEGRRDAVDRAVLVGGIFIRLRGAAVGDDGHDVRFLHVAAAQEEGGVVEEAVAGGIVERVENAAAVGNARQRFARDGGGEHVDIRAAVITVGMNGGSGPALQSAMGGQMEGPFRAVFVRPWIVPFGDEERTVGGAHEGEAVDPRGAVGEETGVHDAFFMGRPFPPVMIGMAVHERHVGL